MTMSHTGSGLRRVMARLAHAVRRRSITVVAAGLLATTVTVPLTPGAAVAYSDPPGYTFFTPTGWAEATFGGYLSGTVVVQHGAAGWNVSNKWLWGTEKWQGPDGLMYAQLRHMASGKCLTYLSDVLFARPCVWIDNSQWWATEHITDWSSCPPAPQFCLPKRWMLVKPLSDPSMLVTEQSDLLVLRPRYGVLGSAAQRMNISHIPAPPW